MKDTPDIRFRGFTDAWVQRKLGEIADVKTGPFGSTLHAEDYVDDGMPIITTEHFKFGELPTNKNSIPQVSDVDYKRLKQYLLLKGDIVFSRVGSVDINALVSKMQEGWLFSGRVLRVRPDKNIVGLFLHYELDTTRTKNDVISRAVGQTMPSINTEILKDTTVCITESSLEQTAIGNFFRTLDDTITLYKRKLDGLKELKRVYLQLMFPQTGEAVPRVRFTGFTGDWETQKLGDIAEFSKGNGYSKGDLTAKGTPIILYGRLYTNYETIIENVDTFAEMKKIPVLSQGNEVIVPSSGETAEDISRASVVLKSGIILGGDLNIIKPSSEIHPVFLAIAISNGNQQKELSKRAQGKSVVHIGNSDLKEIVLQFPILIEQTSIANLFRNFDDQISGQVTKLEKLRQLKAAYLQKMFI